MSFSEYRYLCDIIAKVFFMGITVDTIQLKFNVTPSYQQQQIQQLNADIKQAPTAARR